MSVNADFYKLSKRKNSTKQPTGTGTSFSVDLKSGTSFISPTLLLNNSGKPDYNYVSFEGAYYFITEIVSVRNDLWEVRCDIDSLATAKAAILNTIAYVIYDSVANTEIPDNRLPMKTTKTVSASTAACPFVADGGTYILSLTGCFGTTGVYKVSESELAALVEDASTIKDNLFPASVLAQKPSPPTPPSGSNVWEWIKYVGEMAKYIGELIGWVTDIFLYPFSQFFGTGNMPENIRECRFIPFNVGTTLGPNTIWLGTFETHQSLGKLNTDTVHRTTSVSIPWQAADYRRRSPYTEIYLYLPYIGMIRLSSENLIGQSSISVAYTLGLRDGSLIVTVSSGSEILGQYSGNVAASVPVGISNINAPKAAQSIISGIANTATKNLGGVGMSAINFVDAITPNFTCIGGLDGVAGIATNQNITCYTVFHDTIEAPNTQLQTIGSPSMCPKSLSTLTGFCQCMDAHVELDLPSSVMDMVDSYLNSGFFIE